MGKANLLVAQAGGPTTVLNATLMGVIKEAKLHEEIDCIYGAINGSEGILEENFVDFKNKDEEFLNKLINTPASIIGTSRKKLYEEDYPKMIEILKKHNIKYLLYNGGNGSMDTCSRIYKAAGEDIRVIGIPKTIDNDINITDHTPGYGSMAKYVATTVSEIAQDVKSMPIHVCIVETMGRDAGWIAASSALARKKEGDAPHLIYIPEKAFDMEQFLKEVKDAYDKLGGVVVVVSEGLFDKDGKSIVPPTHVPGARDAYYGDIGAYLAKQVFEKLGIKSRSEKPGIAGRASATLQSKIDVREAIETGSFAVLAAIEGKTGYMVGNERISNDPYNIKMNLIPLSEVSLVVKKLPENYIVKDGNGVTQEFLDYCRPLVDKLPDYAEI